MELLVANHYPDDTKWLNISDINHLENNFAGFQAGYFTNSVA